MADIELDRAVEFIGQHLWTTEQRDDYDSLTKFIFSCKNFSELKIRFQSLPYELQIYSTYRWLGYKSHDFILESYKNHPKLILEKNKYHKTIDFYLNDIPFDLKVTVWPKNSNTWRIPFTEHCLTDTDIHTKLAKWMFDYQSSQQRYHTGNRLFVICHDFINGNHNAVKADLNNINIAVGKFLDNFSQKDLLKVSTVDRTTKTIISPLSSLIFVTNGKPPKCWSRLDRI